MDVTSLMTIENVSPKEIDFDEDDTQYQPIPRRRMERRSISRRSPRVRLLTSDNVRELRHLGKENNPHQRLEKRRKQERRSSRPKILSIYEIAKLRKK